MPLPHFFAELRRRRVFRVAGIYIVASWVVIQAAGTLAPLLLLPEWVARAVALVAILGFPFAVALAWAFELTPDGVRRAQAAPGSRILPTTILLVVVIGAGTALYVSNGRTHASAGERLDSIAVLPFTDYSA